MPYQPFSIPPGIARGSTPKTTPGRWFDMNLVRFREGVLEPIGGWARTTNTPLASTPRGMTAWSNLNDNQYVAVVCDGNVYVQESSQITEITPTEFVTAEAGLTEGGYGTWDYGDDSGGLSDGYGTSRSQGTPAGLLRANTISMDSWGSQLVFSTLRDGSIYKWDNTTDTLAVKLVATSGTIPGACRAILTSPERFLIAAGDDGFPRRVLWCDREDYLNWNYSSLTSQAGYIDLDTPGYLNTMRTVREGTLIWSDTDLFLMRYIGPPYVHGVDKIVENTSMMCPMAVAAYNGAAMWWARSGFMLYDGGFVKPVECPILDFLMKDIDPFYGRVNSHAFYNGIHDEVWFFYPSNGSTECDSYATFNIRDGNWTKGKLARSASLPALIDRQPLLASADGHIWQHEVGTAFTSKDRGEIYVESGSLSLGQGGLIQVNGILPDSELGATSTQFTFYTSLTPEGVETVLGPFTPRTDGYMDCRFTCREFRVRISQVADGNWTLGEPEADIVPRGRR